MSTNLFCVYQFFRDGTYERVRKWVSAEEAVEAAKHYCTCVTAQTGITVQVIITDEQDFCAFDWVYGKGIVFPRLGENS